MARGDDELWLMNADGSWKKRLTRLASFSFPPAWSPDGRKVAFDGVNGELYVMKAEAQPDEHAAGVGSLAPFSYACVRVRARGRRTVKSRSNPKAGPSLALIRGVGAHTGRTCSVWTDDHQRVRGDLPSGTVTFLFTDVEGSTKLLRELGAAAYAAALADHRRIVREACPAEDGVEVDTQGDAFFFAFPSAPAAVAAAGAFNRGTRDRPDPSPGGPPHGHARS